MAFMQPEYIKQDFVVIEDWDDEGGCVPADCWTVPHGFFEDREDPEATEWHIIQKPDRVFIPREYTVKTVSDKWWCRLQAPGYLDATDWSGPFDTIEDAREHIREMYQVDPDDGEEDCLESPSVECEDCEGTGWQTETDEVGGQPVESRVHCGACDGTGQRVL